MTPITERLELLALRLDDEGRYVDSDIVAQAATRIISLQEEINTLNEELSKNEQ
jgi:hypothetical protein